MMTNNHPPFWIDTLYPEESQRCEKICTTLAAVGIHLAPRAEVERPEMGILLLPEINKAACEFVHKVSNAGNNRVLVIVDDATALPGDDAWHILQAGASDLFVWNELPTPAESIAAQLQRWCAIDEIVRSPLVRNNLIGQSHKWQAVLRQVVEIATFTDAPILLLGETGTGKELVSRLIHALDRQRSQHELIVLDCTTIVPDLSGSELFGHEKGAFTGATNTREGAFALADKGTLFLDEIGELTLPLQIQLLRVLQEQTYKRVGSNEWHTTNFRLVSATNRDLSREKSRGRFRQDLYYRISSWVVNLPPLRERPEDILPLVHHFLQQLYPDQPPLRLDGRLQEYLLTRPYPGNVRDLKSLVQRIATRHVGPGPITLGTIPIDERPAVAINTRHTCSTYLDPAIRCALTLGIGLKELRRLVEETAVRLAVDEADGNLQQAALQLGVTDRALQLRRAKQAEEESATIL